MDQKDFLILDILQKTAKISNVKLAQAIGLTPPATLERVKKLEEGGWIRGYQAVLDREKLGFPVPVLIAITLVKHQKTDISSFIDFLRRTPQIVSYFHVTGVYDFLLRVNARDIGHLQDFLVHTLTGKEGLNRVETFLIMEEVHKPILFEYPDSERIR